MWVADRSVKSLVALNLDRSSIPVLDSPGDQQLVRAFSGEVSIDLDEGLCRLGDGFICRPLRRSFETTNRSTGRFRRRRLFAAMSALKAGRFIVATLPLW